MELTDTREGQQTIADANDDELVSIPLLDEDNVVRAVVTVFAHTATLHRVWDHDLLLKRVSGTWTVLSNTKTLLPNGSGGAALLWDSDVTLDTGELSVTVTGSGSIKWSASAISKNYWAGS